MASRLNIFRVSIVGAPGGVIDAPYGNDRQQCTLAVEVLKIDDDNNRAPLTEAELKSITILPYSTELFPAQAAGWSCDDTANQYDQGRRGGGFTARAIAPAEGDARLGNDSSQTVYRYMRFKKPARGALKPFEFMACITLDGDRKFSTHYDDNDQRFESKVVLTPLDPYRLSVKEFTEYNDTGFRKEYGKNQEISVQIFYWDLPRSVEIFQLYTDTATSDSPFAKLQYAYSNQPGEVFAGAIIFPRVTALSLASLNYPWVFQIPKMADPSSTIDLVDKGRISLRALRYACKGADSFYSFNNVLYFTLIDNFGCESRFAFKANGADNGYTPLLQDA